MINCRSYLYVNVEMLMYGSLELCLFQHVFQFNKIMCV